MSRYFYTDLNGLQKGPVGSRELRELFNSGFVSPKTKVCDEGTQTWTTAEMILDNSTKANSDDKHIDATVTKLNKVANPDLRRNWGIVLVCLAILSAFGVAATYNQLQPLTNAVAETQANAKAFMDSYGFKNANDLYEAAIKDSNLARTIRMDNESVANKIGYLKENTTSGWEIPTALFTFQSIDGAVTSGVTGRLSTFAPGMVESILILIVGVRLLVGSSKCVTCPKCNNPNSKPKGKYFVSGRDRPSRCSKCGHEWSDS